MPTATSPTCIEMRAAYSRRVQMSRPKLSVPIKLAAEGGNICASDSRVGSYAESSGPNSARPTRTSNIDPPRIAPRWRNRRRPSTAPGSRTLPSPLPTGSAGASTTELAIADPRVDPGISQVHQQVEHHIERGDDQHDSLDDGKVAVAQPLHQQPANPLARKHRLDHHRVGDQEAGLHAQQRD